MGVVASQWAISIGQSVALGVRHWAEIIAALTTILAHQTRNSRFNGDSIPLLQVFHLTAHLHNCGRGLVTKHVRLLEDKFGHTGVLPQMQVRSTDSSAVRVQQHLWKKKRVSVWYLSYNKYNQTFTIGLQSLWDWPLFQANVLLTVENQSSVLFVKQWLVKLFCHLVEWLNGGFEQGGNKTTSCQLSQLGCVFTENYR